MTATMRRGGPAATTPTIGTRAIRHGQLWERVILVVSWMT